MINFTRPIVATSALVLLVAGTSVASENSLGAASLLLSQGEAPPPPPPPEHKSTPDREPDLSPRIAFGDAGAWSWTVGGGVAFSDSNTDVNANLGLGVFLSDQFEFTFGLSGWSFFQDGDGEDALGINPTIAFRYHFMPKEVFNVYLEAGIGLLFTDEEVPDGGTHFNFTPRAGIGTLIRLDPESGLRLDLGVRWHHISNANTSGSDENPALDSIMIYAGLVFPF